MASLKGRLPAARTRDPDWGGEGAANWPTNADTDDRHAEVHGRLLRSGPSPGSRPPKNNHNKHHNKTSGGRRGARRAPQKSHRDREVGRGRYFHVTRARTGHRLRGSEAADDLCRAFDAAQIPTGAHNHYTNASLASRALRPSRGRRRHASPPPVGARGVSRHPSQPGQLARKSGSRAAQPPAQWKFARTPQITHLVGPSRREERRAW